MRNSNSEEPKEKREYNIILERRKNNKELPNKQRGGREERNVERKNTKRIKRKERRL